MFRPRHPLPRPAFPAEHACPPSNRSCALSLNGFNSCSPLPLNIPNSKPSTLQTTNLDAASSLTPLFATLTKNTRGRGTSASFLCVNSAYSASQRYPFLSSTAVSCKLLAVSFPRVTPNSFTIRTSAKHTHNPFRIRTSKTQNLKSFRICTYKKNGGGGLIV
jgi:hypothetical protein